MKIGTAIAGIVGAHLDPETHRMFDVLRERMGGEKLAGEVGAGKVIIDRLKDGGTASAGRGGAAHAEDSGAVLGNGSGREDAGRGGRVGGVTYRARCVGKKRRMQAKARPQPYAETLDVDPVGVPFMGGVVHGFTSRPADGFTATPIDERVTINGETMAADQSSNSVASTLALRLQLGIRYLVTLVSGPDPGGMGSGRCVLNSQTRSASSGTTSLRRWASLPRTSTRSQDSVRRSARTSFTPQCSRCGYARNYGRTTA